LKEGVGAEMVSHPRPNVVVSKCLEFEACRYNGQLIHDAFVRKLEKHVNYIPVCPEVAIGLGVPRFPIRIVSAKERRLIQPATGRDITEDMSRFCEEFLSSLDQVDGFILKFRSPSCGFKDVKIYQKSEKSPAVDKGAGFFGGSVLKRFPGLALEDEGRLRSLKIREHFLTKLFTLAEFQAVKRSNEMRELVRFHTESKLLLMAYNQREMRMLGNVVANHERKPLPDVLMNYEDHLQKAMESPPKRTSNINVLMHILGHFSQELSKSEKQFFLETLELYREGRVPFTSALALAKSWAVRFQNQYLLSQSFFDPYPSDLMEWSDAGRPIEL
jgi:uncharacterized protein YbgA (DUF1722 family)/uncharacterized protein YbbK (DUF523 family)